MSRDDKQRRLLDAAYDILAPLWPDAAPLLAYRDCFELLCAVLLSAQCTDEQVNRVTPGLFSRWPDAESLARAPIPEVETAIRSVGFYRTKARHLAASASIIARQYGGSVPATMEELLGLPGVGRKTANLVLSACSGYPGIIVDTHVLRVCARLGLGDGLDAGRTEARLAELVPPNRRTRLSHALNRHGKHVCSARKPACVEASVRAASALGPCPLLELCPRVGLEPADGPDGDTARRR